MKYLFLILLSVVYFIILPLNIHTTDRPTYWNFIILWDIIFLLFWLIPLGILVFKKNITRLSILILILVNILFIILFYLLTEVIYLDMRKKLEETKEQNIKILVEKAKGN